MNGVCPFIVTSFPPPFNNKTTSVASMPQMIIQADLITSLPPVKNKVMRFCRRVCALLAATEVVLLLKSGGNEVHSSLTMNVINDERH
jgi:hypothetical protein